MVVRKPPTSKYNSLLLPVIEKLTLTKADKKLGRYIYKKSDKATFSKLM